MRANLKSLYFIFITFVFINPVFGFQFNTPVPLENFHPVNFIMPANSNVGCTKLSYSKPNYIKNEPEYKGEKQLYGHLILGSKKNRIFAFVLDIINSNKMFFYFDTNCNNNLADEKRLLNKGSSNFATEIKIPWIYLSDNCYFGLFKIWFFINDYGWKNMRASHYSKTQLQGDVYIGGRQYKAYLADKGYNDANLTNDGICIDLNRNGNIENNEMYKKNVTINGQKYAFNIFCAAERKNGYNQYKPQLKNKALPTDIIDRIYCYTENGVKKFSDKKPPKGTKYTVIENKRPFTPYVPIKTYKVNTTN